MVTVERQSRPCNIQHLMGAGCDCQACGWHVRDLEALTQADAGEDGGCPEKRPRADQYLDSPLGRRRGQLPSGRRPASRRAADADQIRTDQIRFD
jgi:hypothetical protein